MNSDDYLPRVLEDAQPDTSVLSDASKWAAVHDALESATSNAVGYRGGTGSLFTVAWMLSFTLGLVWVWRNGRTVFQQWQENMHRRANRRRHGIPDDDDRPFNVAYAAAALARKQREEKQQDAIPQTTQNHSLRSGTESQRHGAAGLRQRPLHADFVPALSGHNVQTLFTQENSTNPSLIPGVEFVARSSGHSVNQPPAAKPQDSFDPHGARVDQSDAQPPAAHGSQSGSFNADPASRKRSYAKEGDHLLPERRKHYHVDNDEGDGEDRTSKRTRVDGEDFIDGDNDAPWMPGSSRRPSLQVPKRGSKRYANHEDEGDWEMSQDKRARKGSLAVPDSDAIDDNDVDMAHESSDGELQPTRGTKRDRDDPDSVGDDLAEDPDELQRSQPSRKRRADGRGRGDEPSSRSRKRDRSPEQLDNTQATRYKRGRRHNDWEEDAAIASARASESDDILDFTEDLACGGRSVGEIWEVNGQSFKVGLDGRRLRHALVKQQRSKFPMPKDSAHNDARTNVDVVVEKWLNDEEYKVAKERFELAWQDHSPVTTPIKAEATMEDEHTSSAGKRLLWGGPPPSPVKGRASIGSSSSQNPFELAPSNVGRRVASAHFLMNNPGESPKLRSSKSFSKWEKQDMEANSLKKMRARLEKEKKEKELQKEKENSCLPPAATPLVPTTNKPTPEINSTSAPAAAAIVTPGTKTTSSAALSPFARPVSDTPVTPSLFAKPALDTPAAPSLFAKPASGTNTGSIPNFFTKPAATSATATSETTTQPSTTSMFPTLTQSATSSPATMVPAAKPSLTFGPPATSTSTPSESNKGVTSKALFSLALPSSLPSSTPATTGNSKPTFNFSTPPAQATTSDPPKAHAFNFANPQTPSTTSSEQGKSLTPNLFAKPTSQPASAPFTTASNSPFFFSQSSQPPQIATQKPPAFQFGTPSTPQNNNSTTPSGASSSSGSLLNRLGPAFAPESSKATTTMQNAWSSSPGGPVSSVTLTNPSSTTTFGQTQLPSQQATSNLSESANKPSLFTPSGPPKNVFGHTTTFGQTQLPSQQATSNLSESANKPSLFTPSGPPKNVFGQPSSISPTAPPAFSFAKPPATSDASKMLASSVFGKPSGQSNASLSQSATPSIFGKPGGQSDTSSSQPATPSIFGKPSGQSDASLSQLAPPSIFGKPSGQSDASKSTPATPLFGKPSGQPGAPGSQLPAFSIFSKPTGLSEAPQPTPPSIFGKPGGQSNSSAPQIFGNSSGQSEPSKSTPTTSSMFGNPGGQPEAPAASQPKSAFSFNFGNNSISTSTPDGNNPSQAPSTGAPSNFFGFGQPSSTTTAPGTNAFGFSDKAPEGDKK